jgi:O-antigen ligase
MRGGEVPSPDSGVLREGVLGTARPSIFPAMAGAEGLAVVFLCSVVLGQIAKIPLVSIDIKTAPVLVSDLLALSLGVWLLASVLISGKLRLDRTTLLLAGFIVVNVLAIGVAALRFDLTVGQVAFSSLYLIRWSLYALLYLFALTVLRRGAAPRLVRVTVAACAAFAAFGIIQSIFLPNFAFIIYPDAIPYVDWDVQGNRLVSSFLDPNFAGAFIMFGLLYAHAQAAEQKPSYPLLTLFWVALVLTLSRSSLIASVFGLGLLTSRTRSFRRLFLPLAAFALTATLIADRLVEFASSYNKLTLLEPSALSRLTSWLLAWRVFADNPIIGVGYNTFGIVRAAYGSSVSGNTAFGADGGVLYLGAVSGIVGIMLLCSVLWRLAARGLRCYRAQALPTNVRVLGLTLHAWIPSLVIHSAASNSIFHPLIIGPMFLLGGVCARQYYELGKGTD